MNPRIQVHIMESAPHLSCRPILIVDNDPEIQRKVRRLFEYEGYEVHAESYGHSALDACQRYQSSALFLGLRLPDIPGADVCREIKSAARSKQWNAVILGLILIVVQLGLLFLQMLLLGWTVD